MRHLYYYIAKCKPQPTDTARCLIVCDLPYNGNDDELLLHVVHTCKHNTFDAGGFRMYDAACALDQISLVASMHFDRAAMLPIGNPRSLRVLLAHKRAHHTRNKLYK